MKKLKPKYKNYLLRKSEKGLKKRNKVRSTKSYQPTTAGPVANENHLNFIDIKPPEIFKLKYESCESVIEFINRIKLIGKGGRNINIIMDDIVEIGEGAISMLLSVMEELVKTGVIIKGSKPRSLEPKEILEKSGFFKFVKGKIDENNKLTKNTILNTGDTNTPQSELAVEIIKSMETIWGKKGRSPSIYSCVFEMMRNSCDHAFKKQSKVKWHFAVSHAEDEHLVKFSFVDNGRGIIKTFANGILKKFINLFSDNVEIVETAFQNGIESRTGFPWRGKGLPTIYENYCDGFIKSLVVISNDVYIDFDNNIKHKLTNTFSGTYYYWVVDQTCVKECFSLKTTMP